MAGNSRKILGASMLFALMLAAAAGAAGSTCLADSSEKNGLNNQKGKSYSHTIFGELASQDT